MTKKKDNTELKTEDEKPTVGDEKPTVGDETTAQSEDRMIPVSALKAQLGERDSKLAAMAAELEAFKAAQAEAERKKLEAQGEWQKIAEAAKAEAAEAKANAEKQTRKLTLEAKLAGVRDEVTLKGLMAMCPENADVVEYAKDVREKQPELFERSALPASTSPAQGGQSSMTGSTTGWSETNKDYESGIPGKVAAATLKVLAYQKEHGGELPPGTW